MKICHNYDSLLTQSEARDFCRDFISTYEPDFRKGRRVDQAIKKYESMFKERKRGLTKVFLKQGLCYVIGMMHRQFEAKSR